MQLRSRFAEAPGASIQCHRTKKFWVTDITYIRTYEGWIFLAVLLDLFSRQVIGWSMKSQMTSDLAINALLMAVWRRKPKQKVMIHSDQVVSSAAVTGRAS